MYLFNFSKNSTDKVTEKGVGHFHMTLFGVELNIIDIKLSNRDMEHILKFTWDYLTFQKYYQANYSFLFVKELKGEINPWTPMFKMS